MSAVEQFADEIIALNPQIAANEPDPFHREVDPWPPQDGERLSSQSIERELNRYYGDRDDNRALVFTGL